MRTSTRSFVIIALCGFALTCSACSSKNEGKIIGKWKMVSGPGIDEQAKELEKVQAYMFIEFKADGTMVIGAESTDPNLQKLLAGSSQKTTFNCKYKLRSGASVEFYDMPKEMQTKGGLFGKADKARTDITIDGDNMTMRDTDGSTGKLVKLK